MCVQRGIVGPVCALASGYEYPRRVKEKQIWKTKEKGKEIEWGVRVLPLPQVIASALPIARVHVAGDRCG